MVLLKSGPARMALSNPKELIHNLVDSTYVVCFENVYQ